MFQTKLSAAITTILLVVTSAAYLYLSSSIERDLMLNQLDTISSSSRALLSNKRQAEASLRFQAEALSHAPAVLHSFQTLYRAAAQNPKEILALLPDAEARKNLWDALDQWKRSRARQPAPLSRSQLSALQTRARPEDWFQTEPDLLLGFLAIKSPTSSSILQTLIAYISLKQNFIVNQTNDTLNPLLEVVAKHKQTTFGIVSWPKGDKNYVAAASPVLDADGVFLGTLIIGYQLSNDLTHKLAAGLPDHQLLMLQHGLIYTSHTDEKDALTTAKLQAISALGDGKARSVEVDGPADISLDAVASDRIYRVSLNSDPHLFTRIDWFSSAELATPDQPNAHLLVLNPLPDALLPLRRVRTSLPLAALFTLIGLLVAALLLFKRFIKPFQGIEAGIREVLQGNKDFKFETSSSQPIHQDLCANLNQMTAFLQGKAADADDDDTGWDQIMVDLEPERPSIYGLPAVQPAAKGAVTLDKPQPSQPATPPDPATQALYDRYMQARATHNQPADMDYDRFVRRLQRNEAALKEKHGCKAVEFSVAVNDGKVVLKPKLLY
jgi:hypothetical protein